MDQTPVDMVYPWESKLYNVNKLTKYYDYNKRLTWPVSYMTLCNFVPIPYFESKRYKIKTILANFLMISSVRPD